jgi:hypothetical protein
VGLFFFGEAEFAHVLKHQTRGGAWLRPEIQSQATFDEHCVVRIEALVLGGPSDSSYRSETEGVWDLHEVGELPVGTGCEIWATRQAVGALPPQQLGLKEEATSG